MKQQNKPTARGFALWAALHLTHCREISLCRVPDFYTPSLCYPPKPSFLFSFTFCISHVRTYLEVCEELLHLWLEISSFWFSKDFGGVNNVSSHFSCLGKYSGVDQKCLVDYETRKSPSVWGGGDNDCVLMYVWTTNTCTNRTYKHALVEMCQRGLPVWGTVRVLVPCSRAPWECSGGVLACP